MTTMRIAILAHEKFPHWAKTTVGILRYGDQDVVAVIDRDNVGERVTDLVPDVQNAPIVSSMEDVTEQIDALVIGIAPIAGGFDDSWRPDVRNALERGCDVIAGLHYFLQDDDEFVELAEKHGGELRDVRKPPDDLTVAKGIADEVSAEVVLTVGTDCSTGKMTTTMELYETATEMGIDVGFIPTGQTGIMIEGGGHPIDRVISDFSAGAVEEMILERGDEHDYLFVEGQGSINHPAYSGVTLSILHGSMPDQLVLCHVAGRDAINDYEQAPIPSPDTYVDLYESIAAPVEETEVTAGSIATHHVDDESEARRAIGDYQTAIGAPATDPVRFGAEELVEALL